MKRTDTDIFQNDLRKLRLPKNLFQLCTGVIFVFAFFYLVFFLNTHVEHLLNSDDSSELILARLLANENRLLTDSWYYSTELRVLNTQLIYSLFFRITDNWHTVRMLSGIVLSCVMLTTCWFMFLQLDIRKLFFACASILVLPFSSDYFSIILKGGYYYPHITISFFIIGLVEYAVRHKNSKRLISSVLLIVVSFIAGLGGPRQIIVLYIPLLIAGAIIAANEKGFFFRDSDHNLRLGQKLSCQTKTYFVNGILCFVGSILGYWVNATFLHVFFDFEYYDISFTGFDLGRLVTVLNGFLFSFGYTSGKVISINLFINGISLIWNALAVTAVVYGIRHKDQVSSTYHRFAVITGTAYVLFVLLYTFSNLSYLDRYNLPVIVLSIPCIMLYSQNLRIKESLRYILVSVLMFLIIINSASFYHEKNKTDQTSELRKITTYLTENGYQQGYATFWNANILTELSNGSIEVWDWGNFNNDFYCVDQVYEWLQLKDHVFSHPEGKVFWILSETQNNSFHFAKDLQAGHILYETPEDINWDVFDRDKRTGRYYVYGFNSYDEMYALVGGYSFSGQRNINKDAEMITDSMTLYPDKYTFVINGENLSECVVEVTYNPTITYDKRKIVWVRPRKINLTIDSASDDYFVCRFQVDEIAKNCRISIRNQGESTTVVKSVRVLKGDSYYAGFTTDKWLKNGYDDNGIRCLEEDGISYGPYITLVPGTYIVECIGKGLEKLAYDATYKIDGRLYYFEIENAEQDYNRISYEFKVETIQNDCEVRFYFDMDSSIGSFAELTGLIIHRK